MKSFSTIASYKENYLHLHLQIYKKIGKLVDREDCIKVHLQLRLQKLLRKQNKALRNIENLLLYIQYFKNPIEIC